MPTKKDTAAAVASGAAQDPAISDVTRGVSTSTTIGMTEDQKRAQGVDASQDAGDHDYSPEANRGVNSGGSVDTYARAAGSEHPNVVAGQTQPLVLGQAPQASVRPFVGSRNVGEQFHPDIPNAKHQSPVLRGVEMDPRNDPAHPEFKSADRSHPDYGLPATQHTGKVTVAKDFVDLKNEALARDAEGEATAADPAAVD